MTRRAREALLALGCWAVVSASIVTCLGGCGLTQRRDGAGYTLPQGSLAGTTALVTVVQQSQLQAMARSGGVRLERGDRVNGLAWHNGEQCMVYLDDTPAGLAALEHELWHCKAGEWHK